MQITLNLRDHPRSQLNVATVASSPLGVSFQGCCLPHAIITLDLFLSKVESPRSFLHLFHSRPPEFASINLPWPLIVVALTNMHSSWLYVSALTLAARVLGQRVLDLSGDGWTVKSKALNISVPGHLPSQVHLDLLAAKTIGESCTSFSSCPRSNKPYRRSVSAMNSPPISHTLMCLPSRYHGLNDFDLRWIANHNWTYTSNPILGL